MHEGNAGKIAAWLRHVAPDFAPRLIEAASGDATLRIRDALARNEAVAMLGDRPIGRSPTRSALFLGTPAEFPTGPARLAIALDVPIVTFFGVHRGPRDYDLYFEPLAADRTLERDAAVDLAVDAYVRGLEARTRDAPLNWFNFYPYWRGA
jgi:predicted LPLAT superfamily acyltransferase